MCDPATVGLAVTALGTAASLTQQSQNASAQTKYQNNLRIQREQEMTLNARLAAQSAANQQAQINQQVSEKQIETSQKITQNSIEAAQARATAKVASGEHGVAGVSIAALMNDFSAKEARYADSVQQNLEGFERNAQDRKDEVEAQRQGRVASVTPYIPKPVAGPDWAGELAGLAGAGIKYAKHKDGSNKWRWD